MKKKVMKVIIEPDAKIEYHVGIGKNVVIDSIGETRGIAYGNPPIIGDVKEDYNAPCGQVQLVDRLGNVVRFVPREWR